MQVRRNDNLTSYRAINGTWGYSAGEGSTTLTLTGGKRVIAIYFRSTLSTGGFKINGGDFIPVNKAALNVDLQSSLIDPVIEFTDAASYYVEYVS